MYQRWQIRLSAWLVFRCRICNREFLTLKHMDALGTEIILVRSAVVYVPRVVNPVYLGCPDCRRISQYVLKVAACTVVVPLAHVPLQQREAVLSCQTTFVSPVLRPPRVLDLVT